MKICVENKMNEMQSMVIYFWANDDFLKIRNCGQKCNRNVSINTISGMNDFVNSFKEIIEKVSNYSTIARIFVKFFKKANDFEIYIEHFKRAER